MKPTFALLALVLLFSIPAHAQAAGGAANPPRASGGGASGGGASLRICWRASSLYAYSTV